jgi:hypothetical protein
VSSGFGLAPIGGTIGGVVSGTAWRALSIPGYQNRAVIDNIAVKSSVALLSSFLTNWMVQTSPKTFLQMVGLKIAVLQLSNVVDMLNIDIRERRLGDKCLNISNISWTWRERTERNRAFLKRSVPDKYVALPTETRTLRMNESLKATLTKP